MTPSARRRLPLGPAGLLAAAVLLGAATFTAGLLMYPPVRVWQAFLVNFLFWTGLGFAGVVLSAVLRMTDSRWGFAVRRLGECSAAFLPVALLLYLGVVAGHGSLAPDVHHLAHAKQVWLAPVFLLVRDGAALLLLTLLAFAYLYFSLRPDVGAAREAGADTMGGFGAGSPAAGAAPMPARRSRRATGILPRPRHRLRPRLQPPRST